ncbi:TRAP transporter substrate-binding protein [Martelella radicis]|uniref:Tripartite ATP-independent transporter DctP family solute receptor n=1 Tax=Martelella radicis TaxID=1397476 RepID=A0A7W6KMU1_9HYPH|nr:TRAP transporter substrate-binding protein [Martelella radicis]MBB4124141.1 tripartite ATP-independent transporter DctP family solute receptor [Martelella radicis]
MNAFSMELSHLATGLTRTAKAAAFGASLAIAALSSSALAQDYPEMTLKFGHPYNESHPLAQGAQMFADIIGEKTGGNVDIEVYPNSTIGSSRELVESMQIGVVDFALVPTTNVASFYPPLDIFYLPFLFRDSEHAYAVSDGPVGEELYAGLLAETGIRTLGMFESGFRTITTSDKKIEAPEDMQGVKFRVVNNPLNVATFKALGANPTPMPLSEVFTGLQQGTVEGQDNPVGNVKAFGFDKVQDYITLSNHQWAGIMFLADDKMWEVLPEDLQALFAETALETQTWERAELQKVEQQYLDEMEADGMTVTVLTPEQASAFQEAMEPVWAEYGPKIGQERIDAVVSTQ